MQKFKEGDIVVCIPGFNTTDGTINSGGAGYEVDKIYKIKSVDEYDYPSCNILWPVGGSGIYSNAVRKATYYEKKKYNIQKELDMQNLHMKYIKQENLIIGEIYRYDGSSKNIFMWGGSDATFSTHGFRDSFSRKGGNFGTNSTKATEFEKAWLREMINKNKFIPEGEFSKTYKMYEIY